MFCSRCGDQVEYNEKYCNKCGNYLGQFNYNVENSRYKSKKRNNLKIILIGVFSGLSVLVFIFIGIFIFAESKNEYYFSNDNYDNNEQIIEDNNNNNKGTGKKSKYQTVIVTDNTYSGVSVKTSSDARDLIIKDSVSQKNKCPIEIVEIENELVEKYNITAVNLCEMDLDFAREIKNVFEKIYNEYPSVKDNLTNLTLKNAPLTEGYIAAFMPAFNFAVSDSDSTYPWVIKTQILLNTTYFLNLDRLESSVINGSNSGHFPPNATKYSPIAHELGHYLSFLAMMRSYDVNSILLIDDTNLADFYKIYYDFGNGDFSLTMITEAYNNYKRDFNTDLNIDEWRGLISNYAIAKDNSGRYIYDETIAEAFHDVYLNDDNANIVSKYVVAVLKKKLEG